MFLVVTGTGSWVFGGHRYEPGVHEVSAEVAAAALASGRRSLHVSEDRPELQEDDPGELTPEDFTRRRGVQIKDVELVEEGPEDDVLPDPELDYDFACKHRGCGWSGPSSGALARHVEFHHT